MPIVAADIDYFLSGGASNADADASIGGAKSSTAAPSGLFDTVTGAQSTAGDINYRCIYVQNTHATLTLIGAKAWLDANTASADTTIDIGLGAAAVSATETAIADEATAPATVTFSAPTDLAGGLSIGDLAPGEFKAIWLRRTVDASAAASNDTYTLRVGGDTAA